MNTKRIDRLLDRIKRTLQEDMHSPEFVEFMRLCDKAEDIGEESDDLAEKVLNEDLKPDSVKALPPSKFNEVDAALQQLLNISSVFLRIVSNSENIVQKILGKDNSIEPQQIKDDIEKYKKFVTQQMTRYTDK